MKKICTIRLPRLLDSSSSRSGFTLIEILIVLAIISIVMALGLPAISRVTYQKISSTSRKFVGLVRTVRNDSILLTSLHRIAIDLDKNQWWVENQNELQLLSERPVETKKGEPPPSSGFTITEKYGKEPVSLPSGVVFGGVMREGEGYVTEGRAYIHFFPNGFNEHSVILLMRDGDKPEQGYSIIIRPTSGKVEIAPGRVNSLESADNV